MSDAGHRPALDERLLAEQDERRRLAELIHDGPVQHLAAIAQMLDAAAGARRRTATPSGRARSSSGPSCSRARRARDLRELVTGLEPDALREQGFAAAVHLLVERVAGGAASASRRIVAAGDALGENARVGLYQIVRESLDQALRRGPPTRISVRVTRHRERRRRARRLRRRRRASGGRRCSTGWPSGPRR